MTYETLIEMALDYRERAYAPYSDFKVGAAVVFESGNVYGGCNIENASFGATNCAERTAIFTGIANKEKNIKQIAIVGSLEEITYPCGICRQVIAEFGTAETEIILATSEKVYTVTTLKDILPGAFTKESLENK